jgi:DNA-binding transcriptional regulator WhiA
VEEHLSNARSFFSNRENPNYNKTISESINAIESICKIISKNDKATLGEALKDIKIHPALKESLKKLYGFASDEGGIRHANKKKSNPISEHEAKLILVTSHSIINYLIANNLNGGK